MRPELAPDLVLAILERLFDLSGHRRVMDPMEELISCILTQHTSDALSFPVFRRMMERYRTWDAVAEASQTELAETIKGAGLSNIKARRIQGTLRTLKQKRGDYDLGFLCEMEPISARRWLIDLPGIGPKCASIVLCFALNLPVVPVDTHIFRVGWRLGYYDKRIGEAKAHDAFHAVVPSELSFRFHVALITHGRQICKAPLPICGECPLIDRCRYFLQGGPRKTRPKATKQT